MVEVEFGFMYIMGFCDGFLVKVGVVVMDFMIGLYISNSIMVVLFIKVWIGWG